MFIGTKDNLIGIPVLATTKYDFVKVAGAAIATMTELDTVLPHSPELGNFPPNIHMSPFLNLAGSVPNQTYIRIAGDLIAVGSVTVSCQHTLIATGGFVTAN